jgi:hypothetical protein
METFLSTQVPWVPTPAKHKSSGRAKVVLGPLLSVLFAKVVLILSGSWSLSTGLPSAKVS